MTTRGEKRKAAKALGLQDAGAKKAADMLKDEGVSRQDLGCVSEILGNPDSGLTEDARLMLQASVPWCLGTCSDERHSTQAAAIRMIGEVVVVVEAKILEAREALSKNLVVEEAKQAEAKQAAEAVEKRHAQGGTAAHTREVRRKELAAVVEKMKAVLAEKQDEEKKGNEQIQRLRGDKEKLETVLDEPYRKLQEGNFEDSEVDSLSKAVQAIVPMLGLEQSLLMTLPKSLVKRERGHFDDFALKQFVDRVRDNIASLGEKIEGLVNADESEERIAATKDAQANVETAKAALAHFFSEVAEAKEESKKVAGEVMSARAVLSAADKCVAKAKAAGEAKQKEYQIFRDINRAAFETLRSRVSPNAKPKETP